MRKDPVLEEIRGNDLSEEQEQFLRDIASKIDENNERLDNLAEKISEEEGGPVNKKSMEIIKTMADLGGLIELIELRLEWGNKTEEFSQKNFDKFFKRD